MSRFIHKEDRIIIYDDSSLSAKFPIDWFITQEPGYSLPKEVPGFEHRKDIKIVGLDYVKGKRFFITDGKTQFFGRNGGGAVWAEGDIYISKLQAYIDAYDNEVLNPPKTLPEKKDELISLVRIEAERRISRGVTVPGVGTFKTDTESMNRVLGMLRLAEIKIKDSENISFKFSTTEGRQVIITGITQIESLYKTTASYVARILGKSSDLQEAIKNFNESEVDSLDPTEDKNW